METGSVDRNRNALLPDAGIPASSKKRVVVLGGGFAGALLISKLDEKYYQSVLVDKNNYYQFLPLIYQVASSGLEAASICFPFRRMFKKKKDFHFRMTEATAVDSQAKVLKTGLGDIRYDYLVICAGATSNFFGKENIMKSAIPMKTVEEAIYLRNRIIENAELVLTSDDKENEARRNIVVVGGGATGVEISGVFSELRKFAFCNRYSEMDGKNTHIYLVSTSVLASMSESSSAYAARTLEKMGIEIIRKKVVDYVDDTVILDDGSTIRTKVLVWVSGIKGVSLEGIPSDSIVRGGRIACDGTMRVLGMDDVFAAGDIALTKEEKYPEGHPQLAQVAMQEAKLIARNLNAAAKGKLTEGEQGKEFHYCNLGSMATIGRNKAVADLGRIHLKGIVAWWIWAFIHLNMIFGPKKRLSVLIDWVINYFSYSSSLRTLLFRGKR